MDDLTHRDRVAVVTGAALDLGQAVSRGLAHRGAIVGAVDPRDATEAAELVGGASERAAFSCRPRPAPGRA